MSITSVDAAPDTDSTALRRVAGPGWLDGSELCAQVDPDLFVPTEEPDSVMSATAMYHAARKVCLRCPLQDLCAWHGLEHHERGVWGGTSDIWRRRLRRRALDPAARWAAVEGQAAGNEWVRARRRGELAAA